MDFVEKKHRIGLLVPSSNSTQEPEIAQMMPPSASLHVARLKLERIDAESTLNMVAEIETESRKLADAAMDIVVLAATAPSTRMGKGYDAQLIRRMEESTGKAEFKWILGNRIMVQEAKNNPGPQDAMMGGPFEGYGMMGYDNVSKKYYGTWADNMGTGIMTSEGTADASGKVFTYESEYNCPIIGKEKDVKTVTKFDGDDKMVYQMFDKAPDGKEFQSLEVSYTRAK